MPTSTEADLIIAADTVLTMEPGTSALVDSAIAVSGDRIVAVGPTDELVAAHPDVAVLGGSGYLAIPGLINAHQHLTGDRLIRSMIPDDLEAGRAVFEWAIPAHAAHTPDDDELSATLSLIEAACNGITFTVEAGTVAHPDRVLHALRPRRRRRDARHVGVGCRRRALGRFRRARSSIASARSSG